MFDLLLPGRVLLEYGIQGPFTKDPESSAWNLESTAWYPEDCLGFSWGENVDSVFRLYRLLRWAQRRFPPEFLEKSF